MTRLLKIMMTLAIGGVLSLGGLAGLSVAGFSGKAMAQTVPAELVTAIQNGDIATISSMIEANRGNDATLTAIANALYASAVATKGVNDTAAAYLAAMAYRTGKLTANQQINARNIATLNPTAVTLLSYSPSSPSGSNTLTNVVLPSNLTGTGQITFSQAQTANNGTNVSQ